MHKGNSESGSLGGGCVSIILSTLTLLYLSIRMTEVKMYKDPTISSHTIFEDRSKMTAPIHLAEYG